MSWQARGVAQADRNEPTSRRKPNLGLLIRLAIYVPLLGFFSWRAWERFSNERDASDEAFREGVGQWLEHPPQTLVLPNGEALPMLTPEQAEAQGYRVPASFKAELGEPSGPSMSAGPEPTPEPTPEPAPSE